VSVWGIVPAAGMGSRIQPLAFSKELLPVGSRADRDTERPRAVSEYLIERMVLGGAEKICLVISPGKYDIIQYFGGSLGDVSLCSWIWGAFRMPAAIFHELHALWRERDQSDAYIGTLVNAWLERGGAAHGVRAGEAYVDVETLNGYREAIQLLGVREEVEVT